VAIAETSLILKIGSVKTAEDQSTALRVYLPRRLMYPFLRRRSSSNNKQAHNPLMSRQKHNLGGPGLQDGSS
jgi:hypothetical protein